MGDMMTRTFGSFHARASDRRRPATGIVAGALACLAAALLAACEGGSGTSAPIDPPVLASAEATLPVPPQLARVLDPSRLFVVVEIDGATRRLDAPDADGRWLVREEVAAGRTLDLTVTWWDALDDPEGGAIRLATLSRSFPPVAGNTTLRIREDDYTSDFDEDDDGSTNLEEVVAGSDPRRAPGGGDDPDPPRRVPESADVPGSDFYRFANNAARLQGPVIGDASLPNASVTRPLPFQVGETEDGLEIVSVDATTFGPGNSVILLVVANRSSRLRCFVRANYTLDSTREPSFDLGFTFAYGTAASRSGGSYTSTCIGPGSLAFATTVFDIPPEALDSIVIDSIVAREGLEAPTDVLVEPLGYTVSTDALTLLVANRTAGTLEMGSVRAVLLDDEGFAVGLTAAFPDDGFIAPGEERSLLFPLSFAGSVSTVRAIVALTGGP